MFKLKLEGAEDFHEPNIDNQDVSEEVQNEVINQEEELIVNEEVTDGNGVEEEAEITPTASELEINEEKVSEFLKNNPELLNKLKPTQELDEDVKKFLEFKKDTGRGYSDFLELQKEASDLGEEGLVRQMLKNRNPDLTEEELDDEFYDTFGYDEDLDDEKDIKKKQREYKKAISEATEAFNSSKEKYKVPLLVNDENVPEDYKNAKVEYEAMKSEKQAYEQAIEQQTSDFLGKTESFFSNDFKGFEFQVGEESLVHKPNSTEEVKKTQSSIANFFQKFLGDDGTLKDVGGYHKALYVAMNYESILKNVYDTAKAKAIEEEVRNSKNIDMGIRPSQSTLKTNGTTMKLVQ